MKKPQQQRKSKNNRHQKSDRNQGRSGRKHGKPDYTLNKIHAPYNFVPQSNIVFLPEWADEVNHDIPFTNGYCGTVNLRIHSHTPILLGQQNGAWIEHFELPDGHLAIPGSTLRGMLRNVLEIAAFGKMRLVDDNRLGVRDLSASFYQGAFSDADKNYYKPKVKAGWLKYADKEWTITPCHYARIEQSLIRENLKAADKLWVNTEGKSDRPTAEEKYKKWLAAGKTIKTQFTPGKEGYQYHKNSKKNLHYQPVHQLGTKGAKQGYVIFTGQPGPASHWDVDDPTKWRSGKHMEFIFYDDSAQAIRVNPQVIRDFHHLYDPEEEKKQNRKSHYNYLKSLDFDGKGMPVFYLEKKGEVSAIGLSQMFKLPYDNSIGELIKNRNELHLANNRFDLAELIFGSVDEDDGKLSLKGRVSFSHAKSEHPAKEYDRKNYRTILNGPKPTYYPNYIVQNEMKGKLQGDDYQTYMNENSEIRGWKRYPVRQDVYIPPPEKGQNESVQSRLKPVTQRVIYNGKLRFHNLIKEELGALLWAITWGGNEKLRHAIGMGKPFGLGQISIHVNWSDSDIIPNRPGGEIPDLRDFVSGFTHMMTQQISNWKDSDQLTQLLAMANPEMAKGKKLQHMNLNKGGKNEFVFAKGTKKRPRLVLEKYADSGEVSKIPISEEQAWLEAMVEKIMKQHNTNKQQVIPGKALAEAWQQIEDVDLKGKVLTRIKDYWQNYGGWEGPHSGKSRKAAYKIYTKVDSL